MHFIINEFSFIGQATTREQANNLVVALAKTIQALEPRRGSDGIHIHSCLWLLRIRPDQTFQDWLYGPYQRELHPIRQLLIKLLSNKPYIDIRLSSFNHDCEIEQEGERISVKGSGIAGAAYFNSSDNNASLIGLGQCTDFPDCAITVYYTKDTSEQQEFQIEHICGEDGTRRIIRIFEPHPKHDQDFPTIGVRGTPMDLKIDEATRVLNNGQQLVENDNRIYSYHNQKVYVFHPHRQQQNLYHGFPVTPSDLMRDNIDAYNAARKKKWFKQ